MDFELRKDDDKLRPNRSQLKNNLRCVCIGLCVFGLFLEEGFFGFWFIWYRCECEREKQNIVDMQAVLFTKNSIYGTWCRMWIVVSFMWKKEVVNNCTPC